MCGFTCRLFGAHYEDAICIDGHMWDLDSCDDDGGLTSGGETPCPRCNTSAYIDHVLEILEGNVPSAGEKSSAEHWEAALKWSLELAPGPAGAKLRSLQDIRLLDWPGRVASPEDPAEDLPDLIERRWPWPVAGLSAHQAVAIHPANPGKT